MDGCYIERVSVTGAGLDEAFVDLADGLNVIFGASDTGKSYLTSLINFALGASARPRAIDAARGYTSVSLRLRRRSGGSLRIERSLTRGRPTLYAGGVGLRQEARPAAADNNLSASLLSITGFPAGLTVRKNQRNERRSFSFRDVVHLCLVDETRIISELPPHLSANTPENTARGEVLRLIVTGQPDADAVQPPATAREGLVSRRELLQDLLQHLAVQVGDADPEANRARLEETERARNDALTAYESATARMEQLRTTIREDVGRLRTLDGQGVVVEGLGRRFELLREHYASDMSRLEAIAEAGSLLERFPLGTCPVCGAEPQYHQPEVVHEHFSVSEIRAAAAAEHGKTARLNDGLNDVLSGLAAERDRYAELAQASSEQIHAAQSELDDIVAPILIASQDQIRALDARRDEALRISLLLEQMEDIQRRLEELQGGADGNPAIPTAAPVTTGEMEGFMQSVEELLTAWHVPDMGRVVWSEQAKDLVVNGEARASHGKGVRALTCSAFAVGLMRHCSALDLPYSGFVVLDSPLVAYKDPTALDRDAVMHAGVKDALYRSLARGDAQGQVIILENERPPEDVIDGAANCVEFTRADVGRYGFIPVRNRAR